jgi:hypothetical protein
LGVLLALGVLLKASVLVLSNILVHLGFGPRRHVSPLRLLPWAYFREFAATLALEGATELDGQVLRKHLAQQFLLIVTAEDVNLVNSDGIEEALDDAEYTAEAPGSIDEVLFA